MLKLESSDDFEKYFMVEKSRRPLWKRNWNYKRVLSLKNAEIGTNANFKKFEVSPTKMNQMGVREKNICCLKNIGVGIHER